MCVSNLMWLCVSVGHLSNPGVRPCMRVPQDVHIHTYIEHSTYNMVPYSGKVSQTKGFVNFVKKLAFAKSFIREHSMT